MAPIICIALIVGFVLWYLVYGLECFLNGGSLGRNQWTMQFVLLNQEISWLLVPGAKVKYLKEHVILDCFEHGAICGSTKGWDYQEVREQNLWRECANDVLPGWGHFIGTHILLPLFPLLVCVVMHGIYLLAHNYT